MQTSKYLLATKRDAEWGLTISTVDEKKSPQEKPIQQKDMLTDITSIFRRKNTRRIPTALPARR